MAVPWAYPEHRRIPLKYADQDPGGDVNGVAILRLFEEARYTVRSSLDVGDAGGPPIGFVLARVRADFLAPVRYPGSVDLCIGITGAGRTSFSYASAMFQDGQLVAVCDATVAVRDRHTGAGYVLTPRFRATLAPMMLRVTPSAS